MVTSTDILANTQVLAAVEGHAMTWFPRECCGLLVTGPDGAAAVLAHNGMDQAHLEAPSDYERTGETGYLLDPTELLRSKSRRETLVAIFHSHCRVGAYFSDEDRRQALAPTGEPWFCDVEYVVLDAQDEGLRGFKVFGWSPGAGDFVER